MFLHEKKEKNVRWCLRGITLTGVITSVFILPWYFALSLSVVLVLLNAWLEKTLFYYTSLYVLPLPDFTYDPDKWIANAFVSMGNPDPSSDKIVGLVFNDTEYAKNFFDLLKAWNHGSQENTEDNFFLSFIIDEDMYYVYLYPNFEKLNVKETHKKIEAENALKKFGKEHIGMVIQMIICKEFHTTGDFALGIFIDNHPVGEHFLLGPFTIGDNGQIQPIFEIEPISMINYKAKIPSELTEEDQEYAHWHMMVQKDRKAICGDAQPVT